VHIEEGVTDSRLEVVLHLGVWMRG